MTILQFILILQFPYIVSYILLMEFRLGRFIFSKHLGYKC